MSLIGVGLHQAVFFFGYIIQEHDKSGTIYKRQPRRTKLSQTQDEVAKKVCAEVFKNDQLHFTALTSNKANINLIL